MTPRRAALAAALAAAALAAFWWWPRGELPAPAAAAPEPLDGPKALAALPAAPASAASVAAGPPLSALGQAQRQEQLQLWQARLERARHALQAYRSAAQYPHESRPIEEHPDQVRPFEPIAEDHPLRMPGGSVAQGMHLRTTQERVFASGNEASRITLTLQDDAGRTLPLRITRAVEKEVTPPGRTSSTPEFAMPVNDAGQLGDAVAGDGIFTATMQPATQGFGEFAGTVRLELMLEYAGQPGFVYFDLNYSPEKAANWLPGAKDALVNGSLEFVLQAQVLKPGRYLVSGRVDDANGKPVALALFNREVAAGTAEFRLPVFGKLIRDRQPAFPLVLRDVEAFLLKPDTFPDRVMLPRLAGVVARSGSYPLASFSGSEWASEERDRYLTELGKDVSVAEQKLKSLGP